MSFEAAVVRSSKFAGIPGSYPIEPILGRAREWRLRGIFAHSLRRQPPAAERRNLPFALTK